MYSGQLLKMKKMMPRSIFEGVKVTSVDNFQGEENDIIILSLVRSNDKKIVGFLKESNRVCVALSRAKMGLFVIGNFSLLKESGGKVWKNIIGDMEKRELVGTGLPLYCPTHNTATVISSIDDFLKVPEGGCQNTCGIELPCGHFCPRVCHRIMDEKCRKVDCSHKCKSNCYKCTNGCGPCMKLVRKTLPCKHVIEIECCKLDMYKCRERVERKLKCGHVGVMECFVKLDTYACHKIVKRKLQCDHVGVMECCIKLDSYTCHKRVKRKLPCGHTTETECHIELDSLTCHEPCTKNLSCGHKCKEKCHMPCTSECKELVAKMLLCGHLAPEVHCSTPISNIKCTVRCSEILSCGHFCLGDCLSCNKGRLHKPCRAFCGFFQPCGHTCEAPCNDMYECPPCIKPCNCQKAFGHGMCKSICGEPCNPFKEKCQWNCEHNSCTKQCNEFF